MTDIRACPTPCVDGHRLRTSELCLPLSRWLHRPKYGRVQSNTDSAIHVTVSVKRRLSDDQFTRANSHLTTREVDFGHDELGVL